MSALWDTNIVIYFLSGQLPDSSGLLESYGMPAISSITEIELLSWQTESDSDREVLNVFLSQCEILDLLGEIKPLTAQIRREHHVKLPDAVIAATAIHYSMVLLTRDSRDFGRINGLQLRNPFEAEL